MYNFYAQKKNIGESFITNFKKSKKNKFTGFVVTLNEIIICIYYVRLINQIDSLNPITFKQSH